SYQGGHVDFFKYMVDLLKENDASHIRVFGGGGGTIIPREAKELHDYGVAWLFSPEDGRKYGLQGMINKMLEQCDFLPPMDPKTVFEQVTSGNKKAIARMITYVENSDREEKDDILTTIRKQKNASIPVLGITGTGGAGKSSLTDELIRRFIHEIPHKKAAILSIDPTKRKTGGSHLGDRIRMNAIFNDRIFMRSLATHDSRSELSA